MHDVEKMDATPNRKLPQGGSAVMCGEDSEESWRARRFAEGLKGLKDDKDILAAKRYTLRHDLVLLRIIDAGKVGGVIVPERSEQGKDYRVIGVGPEVKDLRPGMSVYIMGRKGFEWDLLPSVPPECGAGLFILKEVNVPLIENK